MAHSAACPPGVVRRRAVLRVTLLLGLLGAGLQAQLPGPSVRLSRDIQLAPPANPALLLRPPGAVSSRQARLALDGSTSQLVGPTVNVVWEEFFDGEWGIAQLAGACPIGTLAPTWQTTARRLDAPAGGPTGVDALSPAVASWSSTHPFVHVAWREVSPTGQRIRYSFSGSGGSGGWSAPVSLSGTAPFVGAPVICTQEVGGQRTVFVAWTEGNSQPTWTGVDGLRLAVSTNGGLGFGAPLVVPTTHRAVRPTLAPGVTAGQAYLAWIEYDDDLGTGGSRPRMQRWSAAGPAGALHTHEPAPLPIAITEIVLLGVPSKQGAVLAWVADVSVLRSRWYRDASDSLDVLPDLAAVGTGPVQGDASLAFDATTGLVLCLLGRSTAAASQPLLVYSRVLDLAPLPGAAPAWITTGGLQGLQQVSLTNALGLSRPRPELAVAGGRALAIWMEAGSGPGEDFDIMASTCLVSTQPSWSPPVSITSKPATLPGQAEARSASPQCLMVPGRALVVWDDRRAWTAPDPVTHASTSPARGAPDIHASLVDF